jgi:TPP-dependent pyruvate/acetoin dehydrogenase alpha subunit
MVGPCKTDLKHSFYRGHCHAIASGVPAGKIMAELFGRDGGAWASLFAHSQSDKIWRIDLQDDHESCHPVGLRMTS